MKKLMISVIFILSGVSCLAEAGSFNISQYHNTNDLIWSRAFRKHITHFFGGLTGYYFWRGSVSEQVADGLWGTPDDIVRVDKNIWMASACRTHSCSEKAAYITDGHDELFALIGYMCPSGKGRVDYKYDGCLSLFYHDRRAEKLFSPYILRWRDRFVPGAPVYRIRVRGIIRK
ncbi:TPA: hypothetical protein I8Y21_006006 [Klebsiella oxytoca]|uniref:Uncharacterized protein n=1 Tax=Klebsiella oxytoca TaxID=571 RepID=A0AAN5RGS8_KLEOX|nr:hypothetical protein [Klebsiella oxytoca]